MADEKILKDESLKDEKILKDDILKDEQLDNVAGGLHRYPFHGVAGKNPNTDPDSNQPGDKAAWNWLK